MAANHLALLATRASADERFLGWALARYQQPVGLTDRLLAHCLAMRPEDLDRLRLCRRPEPNSPHAAEQVAQIASIARCDAARLADLLDRIAE